MSLCRESLEVLTLAVALFPQCLEILQKDKSWHNFIIDLVLLSKVRSVRATAAEQFALIATRCSNEHTPIRFFTSLLFTVLGAPVNEHAQQCSEYFLLLSRLLSYSSANGVPVPQAESLLNGEIAWLKKVRESVRRTGQTGCEESLLEGHLSACRELLAFFSPEKKYELGSNPKSSLSLVRDLVDDFLFPASRMSVIFRETGEIPMTQAQSVCTSPQTVTAAFDLLVGLCTGCAPNLKVSFSVVTLTLSHI